ncbi:MAG TPA: prolyl oligopeptidase family serine peptidase [Longimicrobiales bacterium]|nr:prolyl oligopeptidase family serine peptidase [Longimicrobiales bacterium]
MKRVLLALALATPVQAQSIDDFMSAPSPLELTAAKKADRVAWVTWEKGLRNVYTAAAPLWKPVRLTSFLKDDGEEVSDVELSDDGSIAIFMRGSDPNNAGWIANPTHSATGSERAIWASSTTSAIAWRLVEGTSPALSPDGRFVVYVEDGQIYRVRTAKGVAQDSVDRGLKPYIKQWGSQSSPRFSPDGKRIAFVSSRGDHSFIGVFDVATRKIDFVAPSVDCDIAPTWSPDGRHIAFIRRPGAPFGMQSTADRPGGCAALYNNRAFSNPDTLKRAPGLYRSTFSDGSTLKIMVADLDQVNDIMASPAREVWHNSSDDRVFVAMSRLLWADDHLVFPLSPPNDEWDRYYSVSVNKTGLPVMLTTTNGLIEGASSAVLSNDGKTLYYSTNAGDIERRHIWAVPTAGGVPSQLSSGEGIETSPLPLGSRRQLAVLYFGAKQPASVALLPANGGDSRIIYPKLPASFPVAAHVTPQVVITKAPDGLEIHNQLFLPPNLKPGEKRPALIFVHGGPSRQMLPGYHYMQFYHWAYGVNQWLASQGYIVMSVNYRLGIGYGRSFQTAAQKGGARGNAEYQDVLAGGKYLQTRADVDSERVGIWGLSYGGLLTAQALARNSDVFKAGVDMAGVHLWGNSLDTAVVSYKSSPIAEISNWKSPVLLVHGDDDRNVQFAQTVGLVQLLRANNVPHEVIIIPDDTHESLLYSRWVYTWNRMSEFLKRNLWNRGTATD